MSVFRKIFGSISKSDKEHQKNKDENKFLPKKDTPIDESLLSTLMKTEVISLLRKTSMKFMTFFNKY